MKKNNMVQVYDLRTDNDRRIEAEAAAGISLGKTDQLVEELVSVGKNEDYTKMVEGGKFKKYCNGFVIAHEQVRGIGQALWDVGRHDLMAAAFHRVRMVLGGDKARDLERAWSGIGDWLP